MWFRSDLRLDDNPAFQACCETSDEVQAVFIYSEKQLNSHNEANIKVCLLYTSPSPRDRTRSRMPSSA